MFNSDDGEKVDIHGKLRIIRLPDGLYVIGLGCLIPISSREEGYAIIMGLS